MFAIVELPSSWRVDITKAPADTVFTSEPLATCAARGAFSSLWLARLFQEK
jgi:hypothetical protein